MSALNPNKKVLNLFDIIVMTVVANFGIRWLSVAAQMGAASMVFWFGGALLFFLPLSLICANLSRRYPEEGGIYPWIKMSLGEKPAFLVAWLYWVNGIFYYPAILIFLATNFAYVLGKPALAHNHLFITISVLVAFWLIVFVCHYGLRTSKYLVKYGGILGTIIPVFAIIIFSVIALLLSHHSATTFSPSAFVPTSHSVFHNLSTLTIIMFAMAGVEIIPTFANAVHNPKRNLYLGLILGAAAIFIFYTLGTAAINLLVSPSQVSNTAGLMQAYTVVDAKLHMAWLTRLMAFMLTFADLAAVAVWLIAPIVIFFKCTPRGILPDWLHKTNRYDAPNNALMFMGALVTLIVLLTNFIPTVGDMYQVLVLMATILYFVPYLFLSSAYIKLQIKANKSKTWAYILGVSVLFSIGLGILFSFPPPDNLTKAHDIIIYEAELILGPLLFIFIGWLLYTRKNREKSVPAAQNEDIASVSD